MSNEVEKRKELSPHQQNIVGLRTLAESPAYMNRLRQILNDRAPQFVASVVQLAAGSDYLAKCEPNTIMAAAITAAVLDLPIDKNLGFAHIVPYKNQASFQIGAKGLTQLAIRTGQYRFLNNRVVHDGELVKYDDLTGEIVVDAKTKKSDAVIGYAAYFKLMNGYEHAEYWTRDEVYQHAMKYSQAFKGGYATPWKDNFDAMALKTVLKSLLSHWGIMSVEMRQAMVNDQGVRKDIESDDVAYPDNEPKKPEFDGPPIDIQSSASTTPPVDPKLLENPTQTVLDWMKRDGVQESQLVSWAKTNDLCGAKVEEVPQFKDDNLRKIILAWPNILPLIKQIKV